MYTKTFSKNVLRKIKDNLKKQKIDDLFWSVSAKTSDKLVV